MSSHQAERRVIDGKTESARKSKILLVDDEPFNLDLLIQELEEFSFEIATASDGQQALEAVRSDPPDIIFLDLMMPVLDGFGVLERLKAVEEWRSIPVVIISASDDVASIVRGIEMGATDFLPKPFEPVILHARLKAGLEKKRLDDLEQLHRQSLERELQIGREIQAGFLPARLPEVQGWKITSYFKAAREVAGDFYDVFEVSPNRLGLLLGDVTDKGVGSALYMALIRTLIRATMMGDELATGVGLGIGNGSDEVHLRAVRLVNRYISQLHNSEMLATLFLGVLNTVSGEVSYVSAGHDPPLIVKDGEIIEVIKPTGPIVGAFNEALFTLKTIQLMPGSALVLYSDGIPDAHNKVGDLFGTDRLKRHARNASKAGPDLAGGLLLALREFVGEAQAYDDVSLLVVQRDE